MRRLTLVLACLLSACGDVQTAGVVAQVGAWSLTENELSELLVVAQPFPLEADAVEELARHWIGAAALAQRVAAGADLTGITATQASTWLERREALLSLEREDRLGATPIPDTETVYWVGDLRLVAHVFLRLGPETSTAEADLQGRTAQRILEALVNGGSWETAVAESQDPDTRDESGLLGLVGKGELPPELDRITFRLEEGQISSVIRSGEGLHIVYRPELEDVQGLFANRLRERVLAEADANSSKDLLAHRGVTYSSTAATTLRRIANDPWAALGSEAEVAQWNGGALAEDGVARIVVSLPGGARAEMAQADEEVILRFLEELVTRELRRSDAEDRGLVLDAELDGQLGERHAQEVAEWLVRLGLPAEPGLARAALDRYMDGIVSRQLEGQSLPPLFEAWLLDGIDWTLVPTGVAGAIGAARSMLVGATSP